jgi:excisionase family DNA binding protein
MLEQRRIKVNNQLTEAIMENEKEKKKVLTPEEVAKELNVSRNLIYRQLRAGVIPHLKLGDLYLISRATLEKLLSGESRVTAHTDKNIPQEPGKREA